MGNDTKTYQCDDGNAPVEIDADTPEEAAQEYVDGGSWGRNCTTWVRIHVWEDDEDGEETEDYGWYTVAIEPEMPDCVDSAGHDWQSPHEVVGGIEENPGVWGNGGGVLINKCCMRCGCRKATDTWAQCTDTGEQGLHSVEYEPGYYEIKDHEVADSK